MKLTRSAQRGADELVSLIRAEYAAMPGMRLTLPQAARLWHADRAICRVALEDLVAQGFLCRTADKFVRADSGRRRA